MRKIIVLTFLSLDGVMQAPGGHDEDTSGDFSLGGWTVPYFDDYLGQEMGKQMEGNYDLLLGRKTFDIFAGYWPEHTDEWPTINVMTKYVVSNSLTSHIWDNSKFLKNIEEVKKLKEDDGPVLQVHGSGKLIQSLMEHDLVDEYWLKFFPVTLGKGKKLFAQGTIPAAFELVESNVSPKGVILANFKRAGDIKTGSFVA